MFADLIGPETVAENGPAHFGAYQHRLNARQNLTYEEANSYMRLVLELDDPRQRSAQLGVLLNGFMAKHPTVEEATGVIDAALALDIHHPADRPSHPFTGEQVIGMAGSGKKGFKTPNISTPAAIVAAAAGIKVAKCASAATSSVAGSADTLKNLGVHLTGDVGRTLDVMGGCNLGIFEIEQMVPRFDAAYGGLFFAPHVLSLAFPALLLPIKTDNLLYGIAHPDVCLSLEVLRRYHRGDMLVVSSTPDNVRWMDEVSVIGETSMVGVRGRERGHMRRVRFGEVLGLGPYDLADLAPGATARDQARLVVEVLTCRAPRALVDLVAIRPLNPCRTCPTCTRGWTEHCPDDASIGRFDTGDGGFSGKVRAEATQLYPLPPDLSVPVATMADPLACVLQALDGVDLRDARVLVIGDGPMAALAAIYARQADAHVTVAVKDATRLERMSGFGHSAAIARDLPGGRYHIVIESVGGISSEPISLAVTAVAPLGQVVCLGVYPPNVTAGFPVRTLLEKESTLRGSKAYRINDDRDDFAAALELLATDPGIYAPIVTSTPTWSPDGPQQPLLERRGTCKIVYMNELALTGTERP